MTAPRLLADFETRSACELKEAGATRYSLHRTTQVTDLALKFKGERCSVWTPGHPFPARVRAHVAAGGTVVFHNEAFDRRIWNNVLSRIIEGLPLLRAGQTSCTMARALVLSYPGDLDGLCAALNVEVRKDTAGGALMKRYCRALRVEPDGTVVWPEPTPEEAARIAVYAGQDVDAMDCVDDVLPELTPRERRIWLLDQKINDRGAPIDVREVECARALTGYAQTQVDAEVRALTKGHVLKATEAEKLKEWFIGHGMPVAGMKESDLSQVDTSCHPDAARLIDLRLNGAKSSVAKFGKMLGCQVSGRLYDQYQYAGANTLRWTGRLVQLQNLKRPSEDDDYGPLFEAFERFGLDSANAYDYVHLVTGELPLPFLSKSLRSFIKAPAGKIFYGGDFANVEGRFNAWLAGEAWKLQAFRDYDAGTGPDLYKLAYARAFGVPVEEVKGDKRQLGKIMELLLGYQGGVGAILKGLKQRSILPGEIVAPVRAAADPETWEYFAGVYPSARDKHGLNLECWVAIKVLIRGFRKANERIARGWYNLDEAAVAAVKHPGKLAVVPEYRGVSYLCADRMLWCALPSKRLLAYASPELVIERNDSLAWTHGLIEDASTYTQADIDSFVELGVARFVEGKAREKVRFWGRVGKTWTPKRLYGGLQCENIVQASCRDIQADAMLRLEDADYPIVLHTHDDIVSERDEGTGSEREFKELMGAPIAWAPGMPIAVKSWQGRRYGN